MAPPGGNDRADQREARQAGPEGTEGQAERRVEMDRRVADEPNTPEIVMKMKLMAIVGLEVALEAVKQDGNALKYVKDLDLFVKVSAHFGIETE